MTSQRLSGILLLIGSAIFIKAAFMPSVFGIPGIERGLAIINAAPGSWRLQQALFASGALIAAIGFFVAYVLLRSKKANAASLAAFLFALVGALAWAGHTYLRAVDPEAFVRRTLYAGWLADAYFVLTAAALLSFGIALLRAHYLRWVGWMNIGASIVFTLELIVTRDMIPFFYYVITAITAIVFIVSAAWYVNRKPTHA